MGQGSDTDWTRPKGKPSTKEPDSSSARPPSPWDCGRWNFDPAKIGVVSGTEKNKPRTPGDVFRLANSYARRRRQQRRLSLLTIMTLVFILLSCGLVILLAYLLLQL